VRGRLHAKRGAVQAAVQATAARERLERRPPRQAGTVACCRTNHTYSIIHYMYIHSF
jgi:hypothetical protein